MGLGTEKLITEVQHLLDGRLVIPTIQRGYVWKFPQIPHLLDSLYRQYPIGSLLIWKTTLDIPLRLAAVIQEQQEQMHPAVLLDGQQRLTSIAAVYAPHRVVGKHSDVRFDLDTEEFLNATATQRSNPRLLRVTELLGDAPQFGPLLAAAGVTPTDADYDTLYARLQRVHQIRNTDVAITTVESDDYETVADIFARVNQGGRRLSKGDLVFSAIAARWPDGLDVIDDFNEQLKTQNFLLDREAVLRLTGLLAGTGAHAIKLIAKSVSGDDLKKYWAQTEDALRRAVDFLKTECRIPRSRVLSTPNVVVLPALLLYLSKGALSQDATDRLKRWVYTAMAFSYYSNQVEGKLDADAKTIRAGLHDPDSLTTALDTLIRRASGARPVGTPIEPDELAAKTQASSFFNLLYIAALDRNAKDWKNNQALSAQPMTASSKIEYHHIFPKALASPLYGREKTNSLANFAFISGGTNKAISNKDPADYLPTIPHDRLVEQQVPTDPALWDLDAFDAFLAARRDGLAAVLNAMLGLHKSAASGANIPVEAELPDDDEEAFAAVADEETATGVAVNSGSPKPRTRRPNGTIAAHVQIVLKAQPTGTELTVADIAAQPTSWYPEGYPPSSGAIHQNITNGGIPGVESVPGSSPLRLRLIADPTA